MQQDIRNQKRLANCSILPTLWHNLVYFGPKWQK